MYGNEVHFNVILRWQWCLSGPIVTKMVMVDGNGVHGDWARTGHGHGQELGTDQAQTGHGRDWARTGHGHGRDQARARAGWARVGQARTGHERAGHGRIVSECHGYPLVLYINSLRLSVCDRAWEGAGWARNGHGRELGTHWAWARARAGTGHTLGMGTGRNWARTGHEHNHGRDWARTGHGHGLGIGGLGMGGLCPNVTDTHQ